MARAQRFPNWLRYLALEETIGCPEQEDCEILLSKKILDYPRSFSVCEHVRSLNSGKNLNENEEMFMEELILRELNADDEVAFFEGLEEWKKEGVSWFTFLWSSGMSFGEHLQLLDLQKNPISVGSGQVASTMLYAFVREKIVGRINIRHELNTALMERGGHIGYAVNPKYRGRGYGFEIYRQGLGICQKLGLEKVLITCGDQNTPSWRIVEGYSAHLENRFFDKIKNEYVRRYWVTLADALGEARDKVMKVLDSSNQKISTKVVAYITRTRKGQNRPELLVFDHDKHFADAGTQVPAGTIECGTDIEQELLREVFEESGLCGPFSINKIDEYLFFAEWSQRYTKRHVYHLVGDFQIKDRWTHKVTGTDADKSLNFHYYWLPLDEAKKILVARLGDSLFKLNTEVTGGVFG